jgi:hypothetical protein
MTINEKIGAKEKSIKEKLETLRNILNKKSVEFAKKPNDWNYLANLSIVENKLNELLESLV